MKTRTMYNSKKEFERLNPYVLVHFETIKGKTIATIDKSFTNRKTAERYKENNNLGSNFEVMTRTYFEKNALMSI